MKSITILFLLSILFITPLFPGEADTTPTATLPLEEILSLYKKIETLNKPVESAPPVNALIHSIDIKAQLLEEAVDVQATIRVHVLTDNEWVSIPLFKVDANTSISMLPEINKAFLSHQDNTLSLITENKGTYLFTISFLKKAEKKGNRNNINISFEKANQSVLQLRFDENFFTLNNKNIHAVTTDGIVVYPDNNTYHLQWEQKKQIHIKKSDSLKTTSREVESMIKNVHASAISTLEGNMIVRILYELLFTGEKTISFTIPGMYTLEKVYINKIPSGFTLKDKDEHILTINVQPKRPGDQSAEVELIMSFHQGNYLLSGTIELSLPRTSWPVHEMYFTSNLPQVFDYTYRGGSLTAVESAPDAEFTYRIPEPGKKLFFHQYLITSSFPSVTLDYTINLDNNYFLANGGFREVY